MKMKEKKKKILIFIMISIVCILVLGGVLTAYLLGWFYQASDQQKKYMAEINAANSVVYYYGNLEPGKEITINYQKVTDFTEETIGDTAQQYVYHAVVIFDFDGTMELSDDALMLVKEYCEKHYYDLLYYGTAHFDQFRDCGYFTTFDSSDDHGFTYNGSYWRNRSGQEDYLNPYLLTGNWSKSNDVAFDTEDEHMMWKLVISFIEGLVSDSFQEP